VKSARLLGKLAQANVKQTGKQNGSKAVSKPRANRQHTGKQCGSKPEAPIPIPIPMI
jgi:hypothetical protein